MPLTATVVRRSEANAITLPGARIYVFEGLIKAAANPDELAGVIAHEIGHVAHRDGTKSVLQAGGLSLLFGMLLGDFIGGGAVVVAAKTVLRSSYSRQQETAADAYGAELMNKAGGDARALGTMLAKIGKASRAGHDHPARPSRDQARASRPSTAWRARARHRPFLDCRRLGGAPTYLHEVIEHAASDVSRANVATGRLVGTAGVVCARGHAAVDRRAALGAVGSRAGAGDLCRRADFRRAGGAARLR